MTVRPKHKYRTSNASPIIVAIVGEKSSGKGLVNDYLRNKPGIAVFRFSKILDDILIRLGLDEHSRENEALLGEILRTAFGGDVLARQLIREVQKSHKRMAVLDGVRKPAELKFLRTLKNFVLVAVKTPVIVRWQRARQRAHRSDDFFTLRKFMQYERRLAADKDIPKLLRQADFVIENSGTKAELFVKVDALIQDIRTR